MQDSLQSQKADPTRMSMVHWGADLAFYDSLPHSPERKGFISTGKELRDYKTLTEAFNNTGLPLTLYTQKEQKGTFANLEIKDNIDSSEPMCMHLLQAQQLHCRTDHRG